MAITRIHRTRTEPARKRTMPKARRSKAQTQLERDEKYKAAQDARDMVQVHLWVPRSGRGKMVALAEKLRRGAGA